MELKLYPQFASQEGCYTPASAALLWMPMTEHSDGAFSSITYIHDLDGRSAGRVFQFMLMTLTAGHRYSRAILRASSLVKHPVPDLTAGLKVVNDDYNMQGKPIWENFSVTCRVRESRACDITGEY